MGWGTVTKAMNKDTLAKRLTLVCLCAGILASVPLLSGCGNGAAGGHEMTKDDFKNKTPPPEALRGMQEAQKRAGTQANAQTPAQGTAPK